MSSSIVSRHREKQPFFGDDGRGRLFSSLFVKGNSTSVNAGNPDAILNTDAWEVMRCVNYEAQVPGMSDDDIHYELTDLLARTGLFHREIDPATGSSDQLANWSQQIQGILLNSVTLGNVNPANTVATLQAVVAGKGNLGNIAKIQSLLQQLTTITDVNAFGIVRRELEEAVYDGLQGTSASPFVTLQNDAAMRLWNAIYGNWQNLQEETRHFFNLFMIPMKLNQFGKWVEVDEREFAASPSPANAYRVNLRRSNHASGSGSTQTPAFVNVIPLVPAKAKYVWYTDAAGVHRKSYTNSRDALITAYLNAYLHEQDLDGKKIVKANLLPAERFSIWVDRLVRHRLMYLKRAPSVALPPADEKSFISFGDHNIWKHNGEGKLYRVVNGENVYYGETDPETEKTLKADFKCYSTLLKGSTEKCQQYMFDCLLDGNADGLAKCKPFHADSNFYEVATKEISSMHPIIALRTLQRYGFRYVAKYDEEARMTLNKVECVAHWLDGYMARKFPARDDQLSIEGNQRLLQYLELIVQYVNANPTILNKHYSGSSEENTGRIIPTDFAKRLGLAPRVEPLGVGAGLYDMNRLQLHQRSSYLAATVSRSPYAVSAGTGLLRTPFGEAVYPAGVAMMVPRQLGGAGYYDGGLYSRRTNEGIIGGSEVIAGLIKVNLKALESHNKTLTNEDKEKIQQKINNMNEVEKELSRTLDYLRSYSQMLDAMGDYNNQTLSLGTLRDLSGRYKDLLDKHNREEKSMATVLGAIQKLIIGRDAPEMAELEESNFQPVTLERA